MKKMYSDSRNWENKNWKESFENLKNDGYSLEKIEFVDWFFGRLDTWQSAVLCRKVAHKVIKESEKAIQFSIVNQYGNMYEMWLPKSALINY